MICDIGNGVIEVIIQLNLAICFRLVVMIHHHHNLHSPSLGGNGCGICMSPPPKVRIFLWRAFHDYIPSELNLQRHHVPVKGCCALCGSSKASTSHYLLFCPQIKKFWKDTQFWAHLKLFRNLNFLDCGINLDALISKSSFENFAMFSWALWKEVFHWKHEPIFPRKPINIDWVVPYFEEFLNAFLATSPRRLAASSSHILIWSKPPSGHFKLDVDEGFDKAKGRASIGVVIRDHVGTVRAAFASGIRLPDCVLSAELLTILHGLQFALHFGFDKVLVSSDSSLAVHAVNSSLEIRDPVGNFVADVRSLLASINFIALNLVNREANKLAHCIARFALSNPSPLSWVKGVLPSWIVFATKEYNYLGSLPCVLLVNFIVGIMFDYGTILLDYD
ncbi:uncharacterized protein [Henckelia pumila]|uniref:uncharacterized protein n=1 Tax=Henckelia pumila TaxID=405737 RepID=UPI003C6E4525